MRPSKVKPLSLKDALIIEVPRFVDDRGYFVELFRAGWGEALGLPSFVQTNLSVSRQGVLRGLHFQRPPAAQAKLVTVLEGHIQDVIVDLRPSSPTYGCWEAVELTEQVSQWLYVPEGFAHGFLVLSSRATVLYYCSAYYDPDLDGGIRWDDPQVGIQWALRSQSPLLSPKDARLPYLSAIPNPFV